MIKINKKYTNCDYNEILEKWSESHRYYHNINHLQNLIELINNLGISGIEYDKLILTAIYHDIIYDPKSLTNEEDSADFFIKNVKIIDNDMLDVKQMILDTKNHIPSNDLSKLFIEFDMDILNRNFIDLVKYEDGIYKEYSFTENYITKRIEFLNNIIDKYPNNKNNLLKLIDYIKQKKPL